MLAQVEVTVFDIEASQVAETRNQFEILRASLVLTLISHINLHLSQKIEYPVTFRSLRIL